MKDRRSLTKDERWGVGNHLKSSMHNLTYVRTYSPVGNIPSFWLLVQKVNFATLFKITAESPNNVTFTMLSCMKIAVVTVWKHGRAVGVTLCRVVAQNWYCMTGRLNKQVAIVIPTFTSLACWLPERPRLVHSKHVAVEAEGVPCSVE